MTRRDLLAGLLAAPLAAQEVLPERIVYRDYPRCLPEYLRALAAEAYAQRSKALSGITTAESVRARQKWARETFWNLAGGMPERTPLNTRVTGEFDRPS